MNSSKDILPQQRESFNSHAFIGELTASTTHELNNVLGTIEQVSGLAEDLADTDLALQSGLAERLTDIAERIVRQTERGSTLIKRLNRLAHLSDEPVAEFDLTELLENILAMSERFANMRKVPMSITGLEQKIVLRTSPLLIAQAIYNVFRAVLAGVVPGEPLAVHIDTAGAGAGIRFDGYSGDGALGVEPLIERAGKVMTDLGGCLDISTDSGRSQVILNIPSGG